MRTSIIAEAGVNHNGKLALAYKLALAAKQAGADYVKFQTFKAENIVSKQAHKAEYQKKTTNPEGNQFDLIKGLELSYNEFESLAKYCKSIDIEFVSTPFDIESIEFLNKIQMPFWKIPSGEITNFPYLVEIAKTRKPVVMSTGMATMDEIGVAIDVLRSYGVENLSLLHCTTEYPAPFSEVNLKAIQCLSEKFKLPVGYSDHTSGIEIPIAAVALGATIIEKHFTLDRNMVGPDHLASLEPDELASMVCSIRNVEHSLGDGIKKPTHSEIKNREIARKSIVAKKKINKGDIFTTDNITTKRPGSGISPMKWLRVLGKVAKRSFEQDDLIEL